ncbi:hypothetical protein NDU88_010553 [Pleurodeles waltl]|uniref:Uncharacterized protein n=1 Tax=Pleurodeles waltl TaxID=8319 RepID=A0AAV7QUR2_PLEWA|nr:hypothetical protein NDU88_010553 [Pleurodeles waltl]
MQTFRRADVQGHKRCGLSALEALDRGTRINEGHGSVEHSLPLPLAPSLPLKKKKLLASDLLGEIAGEFARGRASSSLSHKQTRSGLSALSSATARWNGVG